MADTPRSTGADSAVARYFAQRAEVSKPEHTTILPSAQLIDWIQPKAQTTTGQLAPKPSTDIATPQRRDDFVLAQSELDRHPEIRKPVGLVPVVRRRALAVPPSHSVQRYLSKPGPDRYRPRPDPNIIRGYFHAALEQDVVCYGVEATFNIWGPTVRDTEDHSLMQLWLVNDDAAQSQSVEAGWMVSTYQYDDPQPHLFTWFTTNDWGNPGDNIGGYDANQAGWVQIDATLHPGAALPVSLAGAEQVALTLKVALVDGNWWLGAQGRWIGYYPGTLFSNGRPTPNLQDQATRALVGGEVYSSSASPAETTTQMGSGEFPAAGLGHACFIKDLSVQTGTDGTMLPFDGAPVDENQAMYEIQRPGEVYYTLVGGPGHQPATS